MVVSAVTAVKLLFGAAGVTTLLLTLWLPESLPSLTPLVLSLVKLLRAELTALVLWEDLFLSTRSEEVA